MGVYMKAWILHDFGIKNLKLECVEKPSPKNGELLIKVGAASFNFRDKAIIDGFYEPHRIPKNLIPVSDAAGVVVAVGDGGSKFKIGDRVTTHLYSNWIDGSPKHNELDYCFGMPLPGGLAEYMIIHESAAVAVPDYLTDEEASTLPVAALTAWYALSDFGNIKSNDTVLVQGTGGVAMFAVQFASALGAKVIVTSSNDQNIRKAIKFGASMGINYRLNPAWEEIALELTEGKGVDLTIELAGGDGINQTAMATKVGGKIAQIGFLDGQVSQLHLMPIILRQLTIRGFAVAPRLAYEEMNKFLMVNKIHPVIDKIYSFDQVEDAYNHLTKGAFGKVVIKIS